LLKGDLLASVGDSGAAAIMFESAFAVASQLGLRLPQLRAATRLARLRLEPEAAGEESNMVREVLETFDEGFDTADLADARAVLAGAGTDPATV
jgi:hypothetical protein